MRLNRRPAYQRWQKKHSLSTGGYWNAMDANVGPNIFHRWESDELRSSNCTSYLPGYHDEKHHDGLPAVIYISHREIMCAYFRTLNELDVVATASVVCFKTRELGPDGIQWSEISVNRSQNIDHDVSFSQVLACYAFTSLGLNSSDSDCKFRRVPDYPGPRGSFDLLSFLNNISIINYPLFSWYLI